ncbi:MAG: MBL fold metallo-hydrolase [Paludibacteraceae bacterium]|nr:MBL fold metallo-hydrolase [Paludibacteraceae bacterium]
MTIQFLGAAREVTGSKHLITTESGKRIMLDCGMYQGKGMETDAANRDLGCDAASVDFVVLTHAHIDHSGLIPYLWKNGFRGEVFCTSATRDLCDLMLRDTAYIQAQDVRWYNKKMDRLHKPKIQPLYDENHVANAMRHFVPVPYNYRFRIADDIFLTFTNSGHMLGSAVASLEIQEQGEWKRIAYTGDIGRLQSHILCSPQPFPQCDYLICESTYGNRLHEDRLVSEQQLLGIVNETCVYKHGKLLIPSFSVGRTQEIVYVLNNMYNDGSLPRIPVYVDSPLSFNATQVFRRYTDELNEAVQDTMRYDDDPFGFNTLHYITDINESKRLNHSDEPCIIISASGMLEAGRIKHHVANHISDPACTILIVGYCTPESLGARIQDPSRQWISIFGFDHKIKAHITKIEGFSGHGDWHEMIDYLTRSVDVKQVKRTFIVHGEAAAQDEYRDHLYMAGFRNIDAPTRGTSVYL